MNLKQRITLGVTLMGSMTLMGWQQRPVQATAASKTVKVSKAKSKMKSKLKSKAKAKKAKVSKTQRTKATKVSHKDYFSLSKKGHTYQLSGSLKKPVLKANHDLKNYTKTTWQRSKQMYIVKRGKAKVRYYYVKNARNGATGWVKVTDLKTGKNNQATSPEKTEAQAYYVKKERAAVLYQLTGNNRYLRLTAGQKMTAESKFEKTKERTLYKLGKKSTYYYVKQKGVKGWTWSGNLTTKEPVKPEVSGLTTPGATENGVATYHADQNVLNPYSSTDFSTVAVPDEFAMPKYTYAYSSTYKSKKTLQTKPDTLTPLRSQGDAGNYQLTSTLYLPLATQVKKNALTNPQSAAFSKDDHYLYVLYVDGGITANSDDQQGCVVRYDWQQLTALGVRKSGKMQLVRRAALNLFKGKAKSKTDQAILNCIKVGPSFKTGHAQSLALNPKTNELWFVQSRKAGVPSVVERLNAETLTPDAAVSFTLKSGMHMGSVLAFDNEGNAYFWTQTVSPWATAPVDSVKIYKGTVSTERVRFSLVMQGLSKAPGSVVQSMSYNAANNRLYLISNGSIFSVPADKLGKLSADDVSATNFNGNREFEGMPFMHHHNEGFVMMNRGAELMQVHNQ